MNKNNKVAVGYADLFRGDLSPQDATFLSFALVTWLKLSARTGPTALSPHLKLDQALLNLPRELEGRLIALSEHLNSGSFAEAARLWDSISLRSSTAALEKVRFDSKTGLLDGYDPSDLILQDYGSIKTGALSSQLAALIVELAHPLPEDGNVYLPWEQNGQLMGRLLARGISASVECLAENRLLALLCAHCPSNPAYPTPNGSAWCPTLQTSRFQHSPPTQTALL